MKRGYVTTRFEKLIKLSATNLTSYVYAMITYLQVSVLMHQCRFIAFTIIPLISVWDKSILRHLSQRALPEKTVPAP